MITDIKIAKRFNNSKRSYLFVNPLQGKHMPCSPSDALNMFHCLGEKVREYHDCHLVIGFAETATALGMGVAESMDCIYIHTTRENISGKKIEFCEEHSHAVEQTLCVDSFADYLNHTDAIVFVDDEISTGKTLINFVNELKKEFPQISEKQLISASLIIRSKDTQEILEENGIECIYLFALKENDYEKAVEKYAIEEAKTPTCCDYPVKEIKSSPLMNPRMGVTANTYKGHCQRFAKGIIEKSHPTGSILVLGTEECMYPAIILGKMLEDKGFQVVTHSTTRSPIGICQDTNYPIRNGYKLKSPYDENRATYIYNLMQYDQVIIVTDSTGSLDSIIDALYECGNTNIIIAKGQLGTYLKDDVTVLLKDITGLVEPKTTAEREKEIQNGRHYCEMLPIEYSPSKEYLETFETALERYSRMTAKAVASVSQKIYRKNIVLVSRARAGTPIGILIKRYIKLKYGTDVPHYTISIIRGVGIDRNAMKYILDRYKPEDIAFIDGWTGKGAIQNELRKAMQDYPNVDPGLAVLSDPGHFASVRGTDDDFLIPSSLLNSTVSGLLSRTFLRNDIIGEKDFHGVVFYKELMDKDLTYYYIDAIQNFFDRKDIPKEESRHVCAENELTRIAEDFDIHDMNLIKPGIGEATRVLLRRMPQVILVHSKDDMEHLGHLYQLAKEKGIEVMEYPLTTYRACGIIKEMADT